MIDLTKIIATLSSPPDRVKTRDWVTCPVCDEPDMRKETFVSGREQIYCVNMQCTAYKEPPR